MLSHMRWGPGAPLPFSRPQTPPPPPPRPEIGWKVGGSRRMARWYAPPPRGAYPWQQLLGPLPKPAKPPILSLATPIAKN